MVAWIAECLAMTPSATSPKRCRRRLRPSALRCARAAMAGSIVACALGVLSNSTAVAAPAPRAPASQQLALLLGGHEAYSGPLASSPMVAAVAQLRPITGERTALPVLAHAQSSDGVRWLRVMLPGRPNGSTGWIAQQGTREIATGWSVVVHLGARRVLAYRGGRLVKSFRAVVGASPTPTPTGSYFVEETLRMRAGEPGGPFALALSARSDVLQEFDGGPGQIAIHGRNNLGGTLGTAASHGCIRLSTASIDWLAERMGPGVPVRID